MLVSLWQENIEALESTHSHEIRVTIRAAVDNLGPVKTIKQCKDKIRNLKKERKKATKKTGATPSFPPYFTQVDNILGCRDVMNLPEKNRGWCKLNFRRRINAGSDSDSDVKKSVLKQVPKKVLAEGDDGKFKLIFKRDKSCLSIFNADFCPLSV